jgi:hypothetical protein
MSTTPVDSNTNNESTYSLSHLKVVQFLHSVGAHIQPPQDHSQVMQRLHSVGAHVQQDDVSEEQGRMAEEPALDSSWLGVA